MESSLVDLFVSVQTGMLCISVFVTVLVARFLSKRAWAASVSLGKFGSAARWCIKNIGTLMLPLWPTVLGATFSVVGWQRPEALSTVSTGEIAMYGGFCGLISSGLVSWVLQMLRKKGLDIKIESVPEEIIHEVDMKG